MARKRKSTDMMPDEVPQAGKAPRLNGEQLRHEFEGLCAMAGLEVPFDGLTGLSSPAQDVHSKEGRIWRVYQMLYWNGQQLQLDAETEALRQRLPSLRTEQQRQQAIDQFGERLNALKATTPRKPKSIFTKVESYNNLEIVAEASLPQPPSPSSPTPARRKPVQADSAFASTVSPTTRVTAKQSSAAKSTSKGVKTNKASIQQDSSSASISPQRIDRFFKTSKSSTGPTPQSSKEAAANTSFSTSATRSFGVDSVFTQPTQSGTQKTDATEYSDDEAYETCPTTHETDANEDNIMDVTDGHEAGDEASMSRYSSDYLSSLSSRSAARLHALVHHLETSQETNSTEKSKLTDKSRPRSISTTLTLPDLSARESDWGSSIDTNAANVLQDRADSIFGRDDVEMAYDTSSGAADNRQSRYHPARGPPTPPKRPRLSDAQRATSSNESRRYDNEFANLQVPSPFDRLPFELQWEVQRLLQTGHIMPEALDIAWTASRTPESLLALIAKRAIRFERPPDPDALHEYQTLTRNVRLDWSKSKSGPICEVSIMNLKKDISCALQRWLGSDRVLYVHVPDLNKPNDAQKSRDIDAKFREWLKGPHRLMGRTWYPFFLQPNKKKQSDARATTAMWRLIMVAPEDGRSMCEIINSALPYNENRGQAARKAYMRLELLLSRTIEAIVLEPEDFAFVPDQLATPHPDDRRFEDPKLKRTFHEEFDGTTVMSDGACTLKPWIAYQWAKKTGRPAIPPALQIRTAGGKGLWIIEEGDSRSISEKPSRPIINMAESQVKVHRDTLRGCDKHVLSVNVVKANPGARPSPLHIGFLPILVDRGVPKAAIRELVEAQVQEEVDEFVKAFESTDTLDIRRWLANQNEFFETRRRDVGLSMLAGAPEASHEKIVQMLEAGFEPKDNAFLACGIYAMARDTFALKNRSFKIRLSQSTTLWGIPDPYGCLEPGEVCVIFSRPYVDAATGASWWCLNDLEGLIARNPALAGWDIQKIRFVFKAELLRFTDLIVFSTKGMRPLASKLQGGDYDGDSFWITWERKLVEPFKNAPAPFKAPSPDAFGIKKDKTLLRDYVDNPNSIRQWSDWLGEMASKRMSSNLLGIATLAHEQLIYAGYDVNSREAQSLVHIHDYLVDSDKQGYDYTKEDFAEYRRWAKIPVNLPKPLYWKFTRAEDDEDKSRSDSQYGYFPNRPQAPKGNIIDTVFFDVVEPIVQRALKRAHVIVEKAGPYDDHLRQFYKDTLERAEKSAQPSEMRKELLTLTDRLEKLREQWTQHYRKYAWPELISMLRETYDEIQPMNPNSSFAVEWLWRSGQGYTIWDKLKASAFAKSQYYSKARPGQLIYSVACAELCFLKSETFGKDVRVMRTAQYQALKLRKVRIVDSADDFDDSNDGEEVVQEEADGYY